MIHYRQDDSFLNCWFYTGVTHGIEFKCDANWIAHDGKTCQNYTQELLCKKDGDHYGPNWNRTELGSFQDWSDEKGRTALVCPGCGCDGVVLHRGTKVFATIVAIQFEIFLGINHFLSLKSNIFEIKFLVLFKDIHVTLLSEGQFEAIIT